MKFFIYTIALQIVYVWINIIQSRDNAHYYLLCVHDRHKTRVTSTQLDNRMEL